MNTIKCVIVGDGAVGKTCLLVAYTANCLPGEYIPTVFDNYCVNVMIDSKVYSLGLWDTAGQEEYDYLRPLSYANTDIFIICFSVVSTTSFNNVKSKWIPDIKTHNPNAKYILVGTKIDMRNTSSTNSDQIIYEQGYNLARDINAIKYIECSSFEYKNINLLFTETVRAVVKEHCIKNK